MRCIPACSETVDEAAEEGCEEKSVPKAAEEGVEEEEEGQTPLTPPAPLRPRSSLALSQLICTSLACRVASSLSSGAWR